MIKVRLQGTKEDMEWLEERLREKPEILITESSQAFQNKGTNTRLRKFLHKDGYLRIAPEVYMRIVQNRKASAKHYRRIEEYAPKTGTVRLLRLTEKQYNNIYMVTGEADYQEKVVGINSHIML